MTIARTEAEWARTSAVMAVIVHVAPYLSVAAKNRLLEQIRRSLPKQGGGRRARKITVEQLAGEMIG